MQNLALEADPFDSSTIKNKLSLASFILLQRPAYQEQHGGAVSDKAIMVKGGSGNNEV